MALCLLRKGKMFRQINEAVPAMSETCLRGLGLIRKLHMGGD